MCEGIGIYSNGKKVLYAKGTNSHTDGAKLLKINEDEWRKYEYLWWTGELKGEHYDQEAEKILSPIDKKKADKLAHDLVKKEFNTPAKIYKWLKDVPNEWKRLSDMKKGKLQFYLFNKIIGYTPSENKKMLKVAKKRANKFIDHLKEIKWFKPNPILSKKEIEVHVEACLSLFHLPKFKLDFKYLTWDAARDTAWDVAWDTARDAARIAASDAARIATWGVASDAASDAAWDTARIATWDAARDTARIAAWDAAPDTASDATWDAARIATWDAARDTAWDVAWDTARDAARNAEGLIVSDLKEYKKKYPKVPFIELMALWEMGLYPIGVVNKKFLIYIPLVNGKKPKLV
jgi:hypothetical protein